MDSAFSIKQILEMGVNQTVVDELISLIKDEKKAGNARIVPFIGAGLSVAYGFPTWGAALNNIGTIISAHQDQVESSVKEGRFFEAADILLKDNPIKFKELLYETYKKEKCSIENENNAANYACNLFHDRLVVTSNYDCVFEYLCDRNKFAYTVSTPVTPRAINRMLEKVDNDRLIIYKFHGDIEASLDSDIIITTEDYDRLYVKNGDLLNNLRVITQKYSFLFLGSNLSFDSEQPDRFLKLVDEKTKENPSGRHYAILPYSMRKIGECSEEDNKNMKAAYSELLNDHRIEAIYYPDKAYDCVTEILKYIYEQVNPSADKDADTSKRKDTSKQTVGALLVYGVNSCTLNEIKRQSDTKGNNRNTLSKSAKWDYLFECPKKGDDDPLKASDYRDELIKLTKEKILPYIRENYSFSVFTKVVADPCLQDEGWPLADKRTRDAFVELFYAETNLYFHILNREQIRDNLEYLYPEYISKENTVVVDIGSTEVELYPFVGEKLSFDTVSIPISASTVEEYLNEHGLNTNRLKSKEIIQIKRFIKDQVEKLVDKLKDVDVAVILKNEATYMKKMEYLPPRKRVLDIEQYKKRNQDLLYSSEYNQTIDRVFSEMSQVQRDAFKGYRYGHMILEVLFELIGIKKIIPSDYHSIHGNALAYVNKVVLSGSTNGERKKYMENAYRFFSEVLDIDVSSPDLNHFDEKEKGSYLSHARKIKECDLLFVCDYDGYLGQQTKCDIYGAYLLSKPIAYWKEPTEKVSRGELDYAKFIPHEVLGDFIRAPEE